MIGSEIAEAIWPIVKVGGILLGIFGAGYVTVRFIGKSAVNEHRADQAEDREETQDAAREELAKPTDLGKESLLRRLARRRRERLPDDSAGGS